MFERLTETVLGRIIGVMVHRNETLTKKESQALDFTASKLSVPARKTKNPMIVAMIGLVGSGKSSVAQELATEIGAVVIEGDEIRVELRKLGEHYEKTRAIVEDLALEVVRKGGNVILDSDFIDAKKRASLYEKARKAGVRVAFVCTYADPDIMFGRTITADYRRDASDFFGGASTKWEGDEQSTGAVVKFRELWRRTPHHYRWENKGLSGGRWVIKSPPARVIADIDTTNSEKWKQEVQKCAWKLLEM